MALSEDRSSLEPRVTHVAAETDNESRLTSNLLCDDVMCDVMM